MPREIQLARDAFKQINENAWFVGVEVILKRSRAQTHYAWYDSQDWFYTVSHAMMPFPKTTPLPEDSHIQLLQETGDQSAVWRVGDAICKIKPLVYSTVTQEHTTLRWLQARDFSFETPRVYAWCRGDDRSYMFMSRLPGETLASAWPTLTELEKRHYTERVADICSELAKWQRKVCHGVDGKELAEPHINVPYGIVCETPAMIRNCQEFGLDCSQSALMHCNLAPSSILIDRNDYEWLGLVGWGVAGYVPMGWIRTKFMVAASLDLPDIDKLRRKDYRERMQLLLAKRGYKEVAEAWKAWRLKELNKMILSDEEVA